MEEFCCAADGQAAALNGSRAPGPAGELLREGYEEGRPPACRGGRASCHLDSGHSPTVRGTSSASRCTLTGVGKHRQTQKRNSTMKTSSTESPSASHQRVEESRAETPESAWKPLYKVGGVAALIIVVFIPIQSIVFVVWPPPSTVIGWFTLFQSNRLLGLLDMDLLLIIDQVLMGLILLALYAALRRTSQSLMAIALTAGLVGIAAYFASGTAFDMLSLSNQYAAATTDAQRSIFLAAGQATLTMWTGTAFDVSYVLGGVTLLITSAVMLRSTIFSKVTASVGLVLSVTMLEHRSRIHVEKASPQNQVRKMNAVQCRSWLSELAANG